MGVSEQELNPAASRGWTPQQNQQMALEPRRRQEQQLQPIAEERLEISPDVMMCVKCA
jgi:hypothetical protein